MRSGSHGLRVGPKVSGSVVGDRPSSGCVGLADEHEPSPAQPSGELAVVRREPVAVTQHLGAAVLGRPGKGGAEILEDDRHAVERSVADLAARHLLPGPIEQRDHHGVDQRVEPLQRGNRGLQQPPRPNTNRWRSARLARWRRTQPDPSVTTGREPDPAGGPAGRGRGCVIAPVCPEHAAPCRSSPPARRRSGFHTSPAVGPGSCGRARRDGCRRGADDRSTRLR